MQCVILAGGFATRMLPLTKDIPKSLIDIDGDPFIYHQLKWLTRFGVTKILLCIGHLGYKIRDYVGNNFYGASVSYIDEGDLVSGTGGALKFALGENKLDDSFLITYGDSFLPIDYSTIMNSFDNKNAIMTIYQNSDLMHKNNVVINGKYILYDKTQSKESISCFTHIDYGLSVLSKNMLKEYIPKDDTFDLSVIFTNLSLNRQLKGYEINSKFFEIGSFAGLKEFKKWVINIS